MPARMVNKKEENKKSPLFKVIFTGLSILLFGLFFTRLVLANILATSGQRLAAANQKIEILKEENEKLENDVSKLQSLSTIENFAKKEGLVKTKNIEILTPNVPIASK